MEKFRSKQKQQKFSWCQFGNHARDAHQKEDRVHKCDHVVEEQPNKLESWQEIQKVLEHLHPTWLGPIQSNCNNKKNKYDAPGSGPMKQIKQ